MPTTVTYGSRLRQRRIHEAVAELGGVTQASLSDINGILAQYGLSESNEAEVAGCFNQPISTRNTTQIISDTEEASRREQARLELETERLRAEYNAIQATEARNRPSSPEDIRTNGVSDRELERTTDVHQAFLDRLRNQVRQEQELERATRDAMIFGSGAVRVSSDPTLDEGEIRFERVPPVFNDPATNEQYALGGTCTCGRLSAHHVPRECDIPIPGSCSYCIQGATHIRGPSCTLQPCQCGRTDTHYMNECNGTTRSYRSPNSSEPANTNLQDDDSTVTNTNSGGNLYFRPNGGIGYSTGTPSISGSNNVIIGTDSSNYPTWSGGTLNLNPESTWTISSASPGGEPEQVTVPSVKPIWTGKYDNSNLLKHGLNGGVFALQDMISKQTILSHGSCMATSIVGILKNIKDGIHETFKELHDMKVIIFAIEEDYIPRLLKLNTIYHTLSADPGVKLLNKRDGLVLTPYVRLEKMKPTLYLRNRSGDKILVGVFDKMEHLEQFKTTYYSGDVLSITYCDNILTCEARGITPKLNLDGKLKL